MRTRVLLLLVLTAALATAGCASSRKRAWEVDAGKSGGARAAADPQTLARAEAAFLKRDEPAQLQAAISAWEEIDRAGSADAHVYTMLARAYYFLGEAHTEDINRKIELFDKGAIYGEKALYTYPAFKEVIDAGKPVEDAVTKLDKSAIEAIYWNAVCVGKWAKAKGTGTILFHKSRVKKQIEHVLSLDEKFFYAAAHRYLGAYYAVAPGFSGGDIEKSKEHFDKALAIAPDYFATRVLYATEYAVKAQDADLYKAQLETVINGKPETLPDVLPEQKLEIRKAKQELPKAEDLF